MRQARERFVDHGGLQVEPAPETGHYKGGKQIQSFWARVEVNMELVGCVSTERTQECVRYARVEASAAVWLARMSAETRSKRAGAVHTS